MPRYAICNETFHDRDLAAGFAFAAECGYTGIEIAPFTLATYAQDITTAQRAEVRHAAQSAGLEVIGLHWLLAKTSGFYLTTPDSEIRQRTSQYLCELARLCADVGGKLMVLGSPLQRNLLPGVTLEQAHQYAADCLSQVIPTLEQTGVQIALEPLGPSEGDFLLTAAEAVQLLKQLNSPTIQLHLDVKAMSSEATPIPDIIRANREHLLHFHANDPNRQGPGFGEVLFEPILQALADIHYGGWISVEVFDYTPGIECLARDSINYLKQTAANLNGK
jgi:sugar phosphate isomerase/epimerase